MVDFSLKIYNRLFFNIGVDLCVCLSFFYIPTQNIDNPEINGETNTPLNYITLNEHFFNIFDME